jgi:hypothetical protein
MAKTRFRGFSVKKQDFRDLAARYQGLKHNYAYKLKVYSAKDKIGPLVGKTKKLRGLNKEIRT